MATRKSYTPELGREPIRRSWGGRPSAWPKSEAIAAPSPASSAFIAEGFLGVSMIRRWKDQLGENSDRAFPAKAIRAGERQSARVKGNPRG